MEGFHACLILAVGLVIAVIGGIFFGVAHAGDTDLTLLTTGLILLGVGGLFFSAGFLMMLYALREPTGVHEQDVAATYTALLRCMVSMAVADGTVDEAEIKTIRRAFKALTGEGIGNDFVSEVVESVYESNTNIEIELSRVRSILTPDLKEKILKASFYILAADGIMDADEEELMSQIRKGLGYSIIRFTLMKRDFLREHKGKLKRRGKS